MKLTMVGRITECLLLAYRTPAGSVRRLVPPCMRLLVRGDWAFWNIVACRVEDMRPAGLPRWLGVSYYHVAYRLYVSAATAGGRQIDGLYFVRSDADSRLVGLPGNLLTDFRFHRSEITCRRDDGRLTFAVRGGRRDGSADALVTADLIGPATDELSSGSPFASTDEAASFLKYRPIALSCDRGGRRLKLAEVFRDESKWDERPVRVVEARWSFLDHLGQYDARLERTRVAPIDYRWQIGRREPAGNVATP